MRRIALTLIVGVILGSTVAAQDRWPTKGWPSATPAAVGLDPTALADFDSDITNGKYGYIDSSGGSFLTAMALRGFHGRGQDSGVKSR